METLSRIPRLQRSASFHESIKRKNVGAKEMDIEEDVEEAEDDIGSLSSVCSVVSCSLPDNSYRRAVESASNFRIQKAPMRFALHCSTPTGSETYLTPTQRANRNIRQLKSLLKESYTDARYKDFEIQRLTRELVELRLEHAQCKKADAAVAAADGADGADAGETPDAGDASAGTTPSLADSGLFDDVHLNHSKESLAERDADTTTAWSIEKRRLLNSHAEQIGDMKRQFADEMQSVRGRLTDRLEQSLGQLGDSNARYGNLLASFELNREELKRAEKDAQLLRDKLAEKERCLSRFQIEIDERETRDYEMHESEIRQIDVLSSELNEAKELICTLESKLRQMQKAAAEEAIEVAANQPESISVKPAPDDSVTEQLKSATAELEKIKEVARAESTDPAMTLSFLRSAIFYLLTDSENWNGHIRAVQSILEFSAEERSAVERAIGHW